MKIIINNEYVTLELPAPTVHDMVVKRHIPVNGTAIAINNKLISRSKWKETFIMENDNIVIITAAFGG